MTNNKPIEFCSERFSPTSPFAPAQGFSFTNDREFTRQWNRCILCRCPILDIYTSHICLGCTVDQAVQINNLLHKKTLKIETIH